MLQNRKTTATVFGERSTWSLVQCNWHMSCNLKTWHLEHLQNRRSFVFWPNVLKQFGSAKKNQNLLWPLRWVLMCAPSPTQLNIDTMIVHIIMCLKCSIQWQGWQQQFLLMQTKACQLNNFLGILSWRVMCQIWAEDFITCLMFFNSLTNRFPSVEKIVGKKLMETLGSFKRAQWIKNMHKKDVSICKESHVSCCRWCVLNLAIQVEIHSSSLRTDDLKPCFMTATKCFHFVKQRSWLPTFSFETFNIIVLCGTHCCLFLQLSFCSTKIDKIVLCWLHCNSGDGWQLQQMMASLPGQIRVIMAIEELVITEVLSVGCIHARCPLDTGRKIFNRMELVVCDYMATGGRMWA